MKIDMLSTTINNLSSINNKEKGEVGFLSTLLKEIDNISFNDKSEDEIDNENELLQLINILINSLRINNLVDDNPSQPVDSSETMEEMESLDLSGIKNILNHEEIFTTLKNTNSDSNSENILFNIDDIFDLKDTNLSNDELDLINDKLKEITNEIILNKKEEIDKNDSLENEIFKSIEKALKSGSNIKNSSNVLKNNNDLNIENIFNITLKKIEYVEDKNLDKEQDILLKISKLDNDSIFDDKDLEAIDEKIGVFNNIYKLESNFNSDNFTIKPTEIRSDHIIEDIEQAVEYIKNNNIENLTLKINPKELGELTIKFIKDKYESKVIITSSSDKTFDLINDNLTDIENHLSNLNIKLDQVSVEAKSFVENNFSGELNQQFNKNTSKEERKNTFKNRVTSGEEVENVSEDTNINLLV